MATPPTIHDVARAAGVSVTTVSHVLNGKGRIDPATRAQVMQVVAQLGYRANRHARGLRSGRSGSVGLLLPVGGDVRSDEALSLDFYMRITSSAAATAFSRDHALILLPPTVVETGLSGFGIDGGIVVDPSPGDDRVKLLAGQGVPVVTIERNLGQPDDPWYVASESVANAYRILDHLADRGARRIALLVPEPGWGWADETISAYGEWACEHAAEQLVVPVAMRHGEQNAYAAVRQLLTSPDSPDAIFVDASRFVRGVVQAASAVGRRIPDELLIAASVDSVQAREGEPPVTAFDLHPERQAEAAVEMLLARLSGKDVEAPQHIPATLRLRASTCRP
jgi:DNA-binding LacI/PurR family transcriptional regulator